MVWDKQTWIDPGWDGDQSQGKVVGRQGRQAVRDDAVCLLVERSISWWPAARLDPSVTNLVLLPVRHSSSAANSSPVPLHYIADSAVLYLTPAHVPGSCSLPLTTDVTGRRAVTTPCETRA